tara:strand:+ start:150 stop:695 length:546 start_codon:yes stop_codon:yes gene_type:complete
MKKKLILLIIMFGFFSQVSANYTQLAYDFQFQGIDGKVIKLSDYRDRVIVVVNVASRCGFTNQYDGLQNVWDKYKENDLVVIGVPTNDFKQEPGSNNEIKNFCESNFNISFPMAEKTNVIGKNSHPFFNWAKINHGNSAIPKWNFHKIIIGKNGKVVDTFSSITKPSSKKFIDFIENEIKS